MLNQWLIILVYGTKSVEFVVDNVGYNIDVGITGQLSR